MTNREKLRLWEVMFDADRRALALKIAAEKDRAEKERNLADLRRRQAVVIADLRRRMAENRAEESEHLSAAEARRMAEEAAERCQH